MSLLKNCQEPKQIELAGEDFPWAENWCDLMWRVEWRKEGKGEEIIEKAIQPFGAEVKRKEKSQWVRLRIVQFWRIVWMRASKREEKNIGNWGKLWEIYSKEEASEWKKKII